MTGLLRKIFGGEEAEPRFWQWFTLHQNEFQNLNAISEKAMGQMARELERVHKGLTFEFGPGDGVKQEFTISADGVKERFPAVQSLVAAAPEFPQWAVVAFRQPRHLGTGQLEFNGQTLDQDDIFFQSAVGDGRINLRLYLRGLNKENESALQGASFLMLDFALGEYDMETFVGALEWQPLPRDPAALGLLPFRDLASVVAQAKAGAIRS